MSLSSAIYRYSLASHCTLSIVDDLGGLLKTIDTLEDKLGSTECVR